MSDSNDFSNLRLLGPLVDRVRRDTCCVKKRGKPPARINEALTDAKLHKHLNGGPAFGVYPMQPGDSRVSVSVVDLDSHKGETPWHLMQEAALRIMRELEAVGMVPIPFRSSGGHGVHIYDIWEQPQDARSVRAAIRAAIQRAGFKEGTGGVAVGEAEIFPKQDNVPVDGFGNMFVLPLADASVPLDSFELDDLPRYAQVEWAMSAPVPTLAREPAPAMSAAGEPTGLSSAFLSALAAIPNSGDHELDYDEWRNVLFAIHYETGGSADGLALAHEFSARSSKYDAVKTERDWGYAGRSQSTPITGRTILKMAREHGWQEPVDDDFEVVAHGGGERPAYRRNSNGEILALVGNVVAALRRPDECGAVIRRDEFRADTTIDGRALTDEDVTRIQMHLEARSFAKLSIEMMRQALNLVAAENVHDSAIEWAEMLKWDGVPRIESFFVEHFGADDTPYARAVARYTWTALAGRVLVPGVQADMVPTLVGPQGLGKTQGVKAMSPAPELFCELGFHERDVEASRKMRGRLVIELGELRGMSTKEAESIKAFITRQTELFRDLYRNSMTEFQRRFLFIGTTNKDHFLSDPTGERRWLPINVTVCDPTTIAAARDQLWAEAVVAFRQHGVEWRDAQRLAAGEHDAFKVLDDWEPAVAAWLTQADDLTGEPRPLDREFVQTNDILAGALHFDVRAIAPAHSARVVAMLKKWGWQVADKRVNGRKARVYLPPTGELAS